jgi:hypothetical protein
MVCPSDIRVRHGRMFEGRSAVKERAREGKRSEVRNPKSEGNPKSEIRSQRGEGRRRGGRGV